MTKAVSEKTPKKRLVNCPRCRKEIAYLTDNPWRPFCSQRCAEIDLGAWANENYRIESEEEDPQEEERHTPMR